MIKIKRYPSTLLICLAISGATLTAVAGQSVCAVCTDALTGFDTPTLVQNPGSMSKSNGNVEPTGDTFAVDQQAFEREHDVTDGLGPLYNARACVDCHQNPVSGGASQFTELRAGHLDSTGTFVAATVPIGGSIIKDGSITIVSDIIKARSIINDRAVVPAAQEHIPATENIRALRAALNTLGDGFVEVIDDQKLRDIAAQQPYQSYGRIHGEAVVVSLFEAPSVTRVGRFGWKDQHGSLLSFVADAYLNEMGITNRLRRTDTTTIGKMTKDPEDTPDELHLDDIDHFAQFIRSTKPPPTDASFTTQDAQSGLTLFQNIGCAICHVPKIQTLPTGTVINGLIGPNGGPFTVPAALGDKFIHPYSDFLLHDIGTGDGIVQGNGLAPPPPQDTRLKLRTSPLWGLRTKPRFMHDLRSLSLEDAIKRHEGEADEVAERFFRLSPTEQQLIITFLNSL
jgi:CxxC motif-containing protein (DUF1111 family)